MNNNDYDNDEQIVKDILFHLILKDDEDDKK